LRRLIALGAAAVVLVVLVVAQLVLPGLAAQRLRDRLAHSGTVLKVEVSAFPAIKLLWHQADHVVVRMGRYASRAGPLGGTLAQTSDVGTLDASAQEFDSGILTLRDASLRKRGSELTGGATVTEADLRSAVPFLDNVQPVASGAGQLTLRGTATLLGLSATVDATVVARNGALIVAPDVPFGGLAAITLFDNPHVRVQSVGATTIAGGFRLSAQARVG
jgi:hypothetical protein